MSSSQIFVDENGDALTFYIRPSKEKRRIRSLIVKNGGQLISNPGVDEGCIRLIEEGTLVIQKGNILSRFIDDCLKADRLLDKERYLIKDFGVARLHSVEDDDHGVSNSILTSTKEKVTLMAKCSGRKKYTYQEDMDIIRYLIKNKRYRDTKGNSVWKEMEEEQVGDHSWQSMKKHFSVYIMNNLSSYAICSNWRNLLLLRSPSNDEDETSEENTVDGDDDAMRNESYDSQFDNLVDRIITPSKIKNNRSTQEAGVTRRTLKAGTSSSQLKVKKHLPKVSLEQLVEELESDENILLSKNRNTVGDHPSTSTPKRSTRISRLNRRKPSARKSPLEVVEDRRQDISVDRKNGSPESHRPTSSSSTANVGAQMQGRKVKKVRKSEKQAVQVIEIESEDNISYSASIYTDTTYVPSPGDQNMNLSSNNGAKIGSSTSICRKKNDSEWKQLARNKQMLKPNKFKVTNDNVENRVSSTKVEINTWDKEAVSSISSNDDFDVDVDKVLVAPEENDEVYFMRRIQEVQQLDMKLSQHQIFQLLWQFSNNFDDVICYIKHGYGKDGSLPWNSKDDEVLLTQSREKLQNLVDKYCLNNVINRAAFLDKMDELKAADSSAQ